MNMCLNNDSVGLGKTIEILGMFAKLWLDRMNYDTSPLRNHHYGPCRPILLLVPPNLINQWMRAILDWLPKAHIQVYYPTKKTSQWSHRRVKWLGKDEEAFALKWDDMVFENMEGNEQVFIISSQKIWAARHGPLTLREWRQSVNRFGQDVAGQKMLHEKRKILEDEDDEWPGNLSGRFSYIVADVTHYLCNGMMTQIGVAVKWLMNTGSILAAPQDWPTKFIGASATLFPSGPKGLIVYFELTEQDDLWSDEHLDGISEDPGMEVNKTKNVYDMDGGNESIRRLRMSSHAVQKFIVEEKVPTVQGDRIQKLLTRCVVKRGPAAKVPFGTGRAIAEEMPSLVHKLVSVKFTDKEHEIHRPIHNDALDKLAKKKKVFNGREEREVIFDARIFRKLNILATSTKLELLRSSSFKIIAKWRREADLGNFTLYDLAIHVYNDAKAGGRDTISCPPRDLQKLALWWTDGSPKARLMSWLLAEIVVKKQVKMVIFAGGPLRQLFWYLYVRNFKIEAMNFHSGTTHDERQVITDAFITEKDQCMVLVATLKVGGQGYNWQHLCQDYVRPDLPTSRPNDIQTGGRVFRVPQTQNVRGYDFACEDTIDKWQKANADKKGTAELFSSLNDRVCSGGDEDGDVEMEDSNVITKKGEDYVTFYRDGKDLIRVGRQVAVETTPLSLMDVLKNIADITGGGAGTQDWTKEAGRYYVAPRVRQN